MDFEKVYFVPPKEDEHPPSRREKILGHLLVHAPAPAAVAHVAERVLSVADPDASHARALAALGQLYDECLLRACESGRLCVSDALI